MLLLSNREVGYHLHFTTLWHQKVLEHLSLLRYTQVYSHTLTAVQVRAKSLLKVIKNTWVTIWIFSYAPYSSKIWNHEFTDQIKC